MGLEEHYVPEKILGIGSDGIVVLCQVKNNDKCFKIAMKIVFENVNQLNPNKEFKFHNLLHLNIIQYYTIYSRIPFLEIPNSFMKFFPESYETKYFKDPKNVFAHFLVMESHSSFKEFLLLSNTENSIHQKQLIWYCLEIATALSYLWDNKIVHRDLKLDDILISSDGYPIICDFGMAEFVDENGCLENQKTLGGNVNRLAPEVLNSDLKLINYSKQPSWELGVICHEICTYEHPFVPYPDTNNGPPFSIPKFSPKRLQDKKFPKSFIDLVVALLVESNQRLSIFEACRLLDAVC